ncbi:MAG: hypothetical protein HC846_10555 [Blastocatellia bacterium]|nr:hypothetical protein [Blastocatellia bacterium]
MIAAYYSNDENKMNLTLFSVETGEAIKYLETPPHDDLPFLDWAKNGENLYLILREGKVYSIWKLSFADNKFEKIREWENDAIFRFAVSKDGERVFYEVGTEITSVIQFGNLKLF